MPQINYPVALCMCWLLRNIQVLMLINQKAAKGKIPEDNQALGDISLDGNPLDDDEDK